jgi:hypothetical protein
MEPLKTSELPLALQQAVSIVRPSLKTRLTDRTYMNTVGTTILSVIACVSIWRTPSVPIDQKVNATMAAIVAVSTVVSLWNHKQTSRDETIWKAAIEASNPVPAPSPLTQNLSIGENAVSTESPAHSEPTASVAALAMSFPENGAPISESQQDNVGETVTDPPAAYVQDKFPPERDVKFGSESKYNNFNVEVLED